MDPILTAFIFTLIIAITILLIGNMIVICFENAIPETPQPAQHILTPDTILSEDSFIGDSIIDFV